MTICADRLVRCALGMVAPLLFWLALAMVPASAQTANPAPQPQTTTATYQDWTLRCDNAAGTPPRRLCEVAQTIAAADGKTVLAQVVIGRPDPDKPLKLVVQLPNGVWIPSHALLVLDDKTTVTATFKRCVQLCFADADLDGAVVTALKARTQPAKLLFADGAQRIVELSISLKGFANALDESLKSSKAK